MNNELVKRADIFMKRDGGGTRANPLPTDYSLFIIFTRALFTA